MNTMNTESLKVVTGLQAFVRTSLERLRREEGEIGSQLVLMAMLAVVATAAITAFRPQLDALVTTISGNLTNSSGS